MAVMALMLSACTDAALWLANLKAPAKPPMEAMPYGAAAHQTYDFYPSGTEDAPLVAFFYGGGWTAGQSAHYAFVAQTLRLRGYDVAVVNYGLWPQHAYPDFVADTALFLKYARGRYPSQRLIAMGHSAGAYNVMMATAKGAPADAVIGISGPYAFTPETDKYRQIFAAAAPSFEAMRVPPYVTQTMPPVLLLHGSDDGTVLPENSLQMAKALADNGVPYTLELMEGIGHYRILAPFARLGWPDIPLLEAIDGFIRQSPADADD